MFEFNSNEGYFLHLIKCALKDEQPLEKPNSVDWQKVFEIGLKQNAANLAWFSVEKLSSQPEGELFAQWQEVYAKAASKCLKQMMEIDFLADEFTKRGYDIMFLKGSKIREYYPSPDMRTMTDIDMLIKADDRKPVRAIMKELGYEEDIMDDGQVDAFKKEPIIYTEIHYDFSAENHIHHELFTIDWDNLIETDRPHIYEMTFEDLYFFNVGHYTKNMSNIGMGIRSVIDCYVLWNAASDEQKERINNKFENSKLFDFNRNLLKIAYIWFDGEEDDGSLDNVQNYLIDTGTYGDNKIALMLRFFDDPENGKVESKAKFLFKRIFPPAEVLYARFKIKKHYFFLLPFLWLMRIILLPFSKEENKQGRRQEIRNFNKFTSEDVENEINIRKELGLIGE